MSLRMVRLVLVALAVPYPQLLPAALRGAESEAVQREIEQPKLALQL